MKDLSPLNPLDREVEAHFYANVIIGLVMAETFMSDDRRGFSMREEEIKARLALTDAQFELGMEAAERLNLLVRRPAKDEGSLH
jgi:hypothetical protein